MPEAAVLPTRRDEAWRYADMGAVEALGRSALDAWEDISVADGETFKRNLVLGDDTPALRRIRLTVGVGARAELFATLAGSSSTRLEMNVTLANGAHFELGGVTIGGSDATREIVTTTLHAEPNATSNQTVRAVHWDTATGNFLGEIKVARDAHKTDAAQDFKALLLEQGASANAVPQLEIFADDVKCAHGATVGELDEAARYYMTARGITPDLAQRLLVQAFIGDAFVEMKDEAARETLLDAALAALERSAI